MAEPKYGGAFIPVEADLVDCKEAVDQKCHSGCAAAWATYEKCKDRIAEAVRASSLSSRDPRRARALRPHACPSPPLASRRQGSGECSGWYMDYFRCVDKCAAKHMFKHLT